MEEEKPKVCQNCKREIPAENFLIHQVHCSRNIRLCPVCKEPVPQNELNDHHEKLHKLLPCKKCGESVCGTDLEDHIRDSCALTVRSCRYCELEIPRRDIPSHEGYCGVRTEQCAECREWVMIKYRQLHLDSNHGFLRLDDDPAPPYTNTRLPSTSNGESSLLPKRNNPTPKNINLHQNTPTPALRYFNDTSSSSGSSNSGSQSQSSSSDVVASVSRAQGVTNGAVPKAPLKRTNDQPQINTAVAATNKVDKDLPVSRGAVKKRPAPKPPVKSPPADPMRDLPYYSALQRSQQEEKKRREQSAYNASVGLPPVLNPAAKLEKLRKMDALQNREVPDKDYKDRLQGRVWQHSDAMPSGRRLGNSSNSSECLEPSREDFKNLKPMSPEQFMDRFRELQLMAGGSKEEKRPERNEEAEGGDRFGEIKTNLSQLRRGLNQIIYSYDNNSNIQAAEVNDGIADSNPPLSSPPAEAEVTLPCEFCGAPFPLQDLVQHQTGCRPDLVQYRPRDASPRASSPQPLAAARPRSPSPRRISPVPTARTPASPDDIPVIPCEFCAESLPIYLITEHQERCGRENNLLYPD